MSTQQPQNLITIQDLEHPRSVTRGMKAWLTLAGAAAAGVLALTATSPVANADTDLSSVVDAEISSVNSLFDTEAVLSGISIADVDTADTLTSSLQET